MSKMTDNKSEKVVTHLLYHFRMMNNASFSFLEIFKAKESMNLGRRKYIKIA
jgi:hypothetical protein